MKYNNAICLLYQVQYNSSIYDYNYSKYINIYNKYPTKDR